MAYGELYNRCYYKIVSEKSRTYYEYYALDGTQDIPADYTAIDFVCRCRDGRLVVPKSIEQACTYVSKKVPMLEGFHFHALRHTFTTNLLKNGAAPKDVQEMLGHTRLDTTVNIYAHGDSESKRASAKILDQLAS